MRTQVTAHWRVWNVLLYYSMIDMTHDGITHGYEPSLDPKLIGDVTGISLIVLSLIRLVHESLNYLFRYDFELNVVYNTT